ncbi:MAG: flagellar export chaperone FliS [Verrucomicrobiae bacterium]|nr:flagellar export chaperone FliS [Verrucomicrobiae bacterium]
MALPNPYQSYRRMAAQTATPGQLVLMLFDGAINFLERAAKGFELDDPLEFNTTINNNILKAQAIINELNGSLDMEAGGELAANLRRLYEYMDYRLTESNRTKTPEGLHEVIQRLGVIRDAWAEMMRRQNATQDSATPALSSLMA